MPTFGNAIQGACAIGFLKNFNNHQKIDLGVLDLRTREGKLDAVQRLLLALVPDIPCLVPNFVTAAEITAFLQSVAGPMINSGGDKP